MKNLLPLALILCIATISSTHLVSQNMAQLEEVTPTDTTIEIRFRITNSTRSDYYAIKIEVSLDGGSRRAIRSMSGDIGRRVQGGKSIYLATWDVFKDVEEIGDAEFFVEAIKLSSSINSTPSTSIQRNSSRTQAYGGRNWFMVGELIVEPECAIFSAGLRLGYVDSWGFYISAFPVVPLEHYTLGFLANLSKNSGGAVDLYFGGGTTNIDGYGYQGSLETGFLFTVNGLAISVGGGIEFGDSYAIITAGLGYRF